MQTHQKSIFYSLALAFIMVTLSFVQGCGNGRSEPEDGAAAQNAPVGSGTPSGSIDGMYVVTFTKNRNFERQVQGAIFNGRALFFGKGELYDGSIATTGSQFSAKTNSYLPNGLRINQAVLSGNFEPQAFINGSYVTAGGLDNGTFNLLFNPAFLKPASMDRLSTKWNGERGIPGAWLSVTADGGFTGGDRNNCLYNGTVTIPDPNVNVYLIEGTVSKCKFLVGLVNFNGKYSGYASIVDEVESDDTLLFNMSNGRLIYAAVFKRGTAGE